MQRITYRVKVSAQGAKRSITHLLRPAQRLLNTKSNLVPSVKVARFNKSKKIAQISSIALLSLPARSLTATEIPTPVFDQVMLDKTLTIAAVPGDSTYFATDGFQHGFGYDPHFYVPEEGCTAAQMPAERKNKISHRALALQTLLAKIASLS